MTAKKNTKGMRYRIYDAGCVINVDVNVTTNRATKAPKTYIKGSFEKVEDEFSFGTFSLGNQGNLFKSSVAPEKFPL